MMNSSSCINCTSKSSSCINCTLQDPFHVNHTSNFSSQPLTPLQIIITFVYIVLSSSSLLAYVLVLATLIRYFKEFKSSFYYFVISLGIADVGYLAEILFYCVPCNILKRDIWSSVPYAAGQIEQLSYFTVCTHLTLIAINRVAYAAAPGLKHSCLDKIFNSKAAVVAWLIFLWAGGTAVPIVVQIAGCDLLYNPEYMGFVYKCRDTVSAEFTGQALLGDTVVAGVLPCLVTACHLLAWFIIYCKGRKGGGNSEIVQQRERERRLLIQFTLISVFLLMYYVSFWAIPYWLGENVGLSVITLSGGFASAVNPFTYLIFNKMMKRKAKELICKHFPKKSNVMPLNAGTNVRAGSSQRCYVQNERCKNIRVNEGNRVC